MSPWIGKKGVLALLLTIAVICGQGETCKNQPSSAKPGNQGRARISKQQGAELEKLFCARLKEDGYFRHPIFPWTIYVNKVQGQRLLGVVIAPRESIDGDDFIGKASEAKLAVDSASQTILIETKECFICSHDGSKSSYFECKVWPIPLPANWRALFTKASDSVAKDEPRLSAGAIALLLFAHEDKHPISPTDKKLRLAFGDKCPELDRCVKIDIQWEGLLIAANHFLIEPDGRLKFTPFSIAYIGKDDGKSRPTEITTLRSKFARITLDRPFKSLTDLDSRKIVAIELAGGMRLVLDK